MDRRVQEQREDKALALFEAGVSLIGVAERLGLKRTTSVSKMMTAARRRRDAAKAPR